MELDGGGSSKFLFRFSVLRLLGGSAASQPQKRKAKRKCFARGHNPNGCTRALKRRGQPDGPKLQPDGPNMALDGPNHGPGRNAPGQP